MLDAVTEEDMRDIIRTLVQMAKGGDLSAMKLLLDRTVGKPVEVPSSDPPDTDRTRWGFVGRECARLDQLSDAELKTPEVQARVDFICREVQALVPYTPPMSPEEEAASRVAWDGWLDQLRDQFTAEGRADDLRLVNQHIAYRAGASSTSPEAVACELEVFRRCIG